jgi:hypothetical protein
MRRADGPPRSVARRGGFLGVLLTGATLWAIGCVGDFPSFTGRSTDADTDTPTDASPDGSGGDAADGAPLDDGALRVFLTTRQIVGTFGGLAGGDGVCAAHAADAGLRGQWVAWLSARSYDGGVPIEGGVSAIDRLPDSGVWFLVTGNRVASWAELLATATDPLDAPIATTEKGEQLNQSVWTGTERDGSASAADCNAWTDPGAQGRIGNAAATNPSWISSPPDINCNQARHLYCFQR